MTDTKPKTETEQAKTARVTQLAALALVKVEPGPKPRKAAPEKSADDEGDGPAAT